MRNPYLTRAREEDPPVAISATRQQTPPPVPAATTPPRQRTPSRAPIPSRTGMMTRDQVEEALHGKRRARQFAASALRAGKTQTPDDLRKLTGEKLRDVDGRQLGKIQSIAAYGDLAAAWVIVEEGRGGRRYYLPADRVDGGTGGAWTSLHRDQVLETSAIVPHGQVLTTTSERLLQRHYAPTITDRSHYAEVVARERLVRRARAASAVQRASQPLS